MNTWPRGHHKALSQDQHIAWNASHYPATQFVRQSVHGQATGQLIHNMPGSQP